MSVWPGSHVLLLAAMAFVMMLAEGSMLDWSAVFLVDNTGVINKNAGIGYTIFSIAMTMSRLGGNSITQRLGRKWITTKAAVLRWIENTSGDDTLARAVERGDMAALTRAMNKGKVRVSPKGE